MVPVERSVEEEGLAEGEDGAGAKEGEGWVEEGVTAAAGTVAVGAATAAAATEEKEKEEGLR